VAPPTWEDVRIGDTVVEHDGHRSVFVIVGEAVLGNTPHWDVVILASTHPNFEKFTQFRANWIRRIGTPQGRVPVPIQPNHEVLREGRTIFRT
jgi:hypothetical protein